MKLLSCLLFVLLTLRCSVNPIDATGTFNNVKRSTSEVDVPDEPVEKKLDPDKTEVLMDTINAQFSEDDSNSEKNDRAESDLEQEKLGEKADEALKELRKTPDAPLSGVELALREEAKSLMDKLKRDMALAKIQSSNAKKAKLEAKTSLKTTLGLVELVNRQPNKTEEYGEEEASVGIPGKVPKPKRVEALIPADQLDSVPDFPIEIRGSDGDVQATTIQGNGETSVYIKAADGEASEENAPNSEPAASAEMALHVVLAGTSLQEEDDPADADAPIGPDSPEDSSPEEGQQAKNPDDTQESGAPREITLKPGTPPAAAIEMTVKHVCNLQRTTVGQAKNQLWKTLKDLDQPVPKELEDALRNSPDAPVNGWVVVATPAAASNGEGGPPKMVVDIGEAPQNGNNKLLHKAFRENGCTQYLKKNREQILSQLGVTIRRPQEALKQASEQLAAAIEGQTKVPTSVVEQLRINQDAATNMFVCQIGAGYTVHLGPKAGQESGGESSDTAVFSASLDKGTAIQVAVQDGDPRIKIVDKEDSCVLADSREIAEKLSGTVDIPEEIVAQLPKRMSVAGNSVELSHSVQTATERLLTVKYGDSEVILSETPDRQAAAEPCSTDKKREAVIESGVTSSATEVAGVYQKPRRLDFSGSEVQELSGLSQEVLEDLANNLSDAILSGNGSNLENIAKQAIKDTLDAQTNESPQDNTDGGDETDGERDDDTESEDDQSVSPEQILGSDSAPSAITKMIRDQGLEVDTTHEDQFKEVFQSLTVGDKEILWGAWQQRFPRGGSLGQLDKLVKGSYDEMSRNNTEASDENPDDYTDDDDPILKFDGRLSGKEQDPDILPEDEVEDYEDSQANLNRGPDAIEEPQDEDDSELSENEDAKDEPSVMPDDPPARRQRLARIVQQALGDIDRWRQKIRQAIRGSQRPQDDTVMVSAQYHGTYVQKVPAGLSGGPTRAIVIQGRQQLCGECGPLAKLCPST